ncbi:kinase-like domain-containing protein [Myxozyma melibiosi]|uniref:Kinase-like domain-containing protein n=1 Tax=Myxozyma melibiosi TaxID=54550 RepID=A0ABR1EYB0_9ASCO
MSTPATRPTALSVNTSVSSASSLAPASASVTPTPSLVAPASGLARARSIDSPTFYRDLTPLPSPIVGPPRTPSTHRLGPPPLPPPSGVQARPRKPYGELTLNSQDPLQRELTRASSVREPTLEVFEAYEHRSLRKLRWKEVRLLGKGSFSRVVLARLILPSTSSSDDDDDDNDDRKTDRGDKSKRKDKKESRLEQFRGKELVAVKIVELAGAGGASRERIESSLKREVDILQDLDHPCLIHLVAFNLDQTRALIVLPFCIGGDLFDLATSPERETILQPAVVRRLFAEVVSAVLYLHTHSIVHRDIKLENVLLNVPQSSVLDAISKDRSLTTLTDFGLSRHIDPEKPMLTTRCGSEDYAPPELIMGQPYDGRQTDAWALGVLLYALIEGRFPFDGPPAQVSPVTPGSRKSSARNRVKHRIARVEWSWIKLRRKTSEETTLEAAADDKPAEEEPEEIWKSAMQIVEKCLQRRESRSAVSDIASTEWVKGVLDSINLTR